MPIRSRRRLWARRVLIRIGIAVCVTLVVAYLASQVWYFESHGRGCWSRLRSGWLACEYDRGRSNRPLTVDAGWNFERGSERLGYRTWYSSAGTFQGIGIHFPIWPFFLICAVSTTALWWHDRRPLPGRCRKCGYGLTGNVSGRCPECGTAIKREGQTG